MLARIIKDRRATAAVEFAIVAPVFLAIAFSICEAGWLMARTIMQDSALNRVVRDLRLNENASISASEVRSRLCDHAVILLDCETNTTVELVPLGGSGELPDDRAKCVHRGTVPAYTPGDRSEFMFVRICTSINPVAPYLGLAVALPNEETGAFGIVSKAAFVNEPH